MRCLALAQEWRRREGSVSLVSRDLPNSTRDRYLAEGIEPASPPAGATLIEDARHLAGLARKLGATVVIDGYGFDLEYQRLVRPAADTLLVIDDHGEIGGWDSDLILDQNLDAKSTTYNSKPPDCSLLLGSRHILLRSEFLGFPRPDRRDRPRRILVTFGGSDQTGETSRAVRAIASLGGSDLEVTVVVGAGSPPAHAVDHLAATIDWVRVEHAVSDMAPIVAWADLAISAAGSTCWEFAFMGLPMILISIAANQEPIARALAKHGTAAYLGRHTEIGEPDIAKALGAHLSHPQRLRDMAAHGVGLVDGSGSRRVVDALLDRSMG